MLSKAASKAAAEAKAPEKPSESGEGEKVNDENKEKDPLQQALDEMEKDDIDIFGVDDICEQKGPGSPPLFSNFTFEDWALLSLRFELHLLVHAVRRDGGEKH